jgi:hypothetical protein
MSAYLDTSVFVSLHLRDTSYAQAVALLKSANGAIWTPWQKLEFGNAIRVRLWRATSAGGISPP